MFSLSINNENFDTWEKTRIQLNKTNYDLSDISKKGLVFTNVVSLPASAKNDRLLGYPSRIHSNNKAFFRKTKYEIKKGGYLLARGILTVNSYTEGGEITVQLVEEKDFWENISELSMKEIFYNDNIVLKKAFDDGGLLKNTKIFFYNEAKTEDVEIESVKRPVCMAEGLLKKVTSYLGYGIGYSGIAKRKVSSFFTTTNAKDFFVSDYVVRYTNFKLGGYYAGSKTDHVFLPLSGIDIGEHGESVSIASGIEGESYFHLKDSALVIDNEDNINTRGVDTKEDPVTYPKGASFYRALKCLKYDTIFEIVGEVEAKTDTELEIVYNSNNEEAEKIPLKKGINYIRHNTRLIKGGIEYFQIRHNNKGAGIVIKDLKIRSVISEKEIIAKTTPYTGAFFLIKENRDKRKAILVNHGYVTSEVNRLLTQSEDGVSDKLHFITLGAEFWDLILEYRSLIPFEGKTANEIDILYKENRASITQALESHDLTFNEIESILILGYKGRNDPALKNIFAPYGEEFWALLMTRNTLTDINKTENKYKANYLDLTGYLMLIGYNLPHDNASDFLLFLRLVLGIEFVIDEFNNKIKVFGIEEKFSLHNATSLSQLSYDRLTYSQNLYYADENSIILDSEKEYVSKNYAYIFKGNGFGKKDFINIKEFDRSNKVRNGFLEIDIYDIDNKTRKEVLHRGGYIKDPGNGIPDSLSPEYIYDNGYDRLIENTVNSKTVIFKAVLKITDFKSLIETPVFFAPSLNKYFLALSINGFDGDGTCTINAIEYGKK